jgi:peptide-methionine (S)-S-oxide reductase
MNLQGYYRIGFGGGCHWCTEAVFKSIKGVLKVDQGWIASLPPGETFSEAVIVEFDPAVVSLKTLIRIHLHTHSSTSLHAMRQKYRSAVYYFDDNQRNAAEKYIKALGAEFKDQIITEVLPFISFKGNEDTYLNYYEKNPDKPFCKLYIDPKLKRVNELIK